MDLFCAENCLWCAKKINKTNKTPVGDGSFHCKTVFSCRVSVFRINASIWILFPACLYAWFLSDVY